MRQLEMRPFRFPTVGIFLVVGVLAVALGACGGTDSSSVEELEKAAAAAAEEAADARFEAEQARIEEQERQLEEQRQELEERQARLDEQQAVAAQRAELEASRRRLEAEEKAAAERHARELAEIEATRRELAQREAEAADAAAAAEAAVEAERRRQAQVARSEEFASEPPAEPEPVYVDASLASGTVLEVEIAETLSSRTNQVGDSFRARTTRDLFSDDGVLVVPAGSELTGRITEAKPLKRVGGQASLGFEFTHLVLASGSSIEIRASFAEQGQDQRGDKKKIAAAAAAGAILGRILGDKGGSSATVLGAAIGAAAGTAVVASKQGEDVEVPAGQIIALRLEETVTVTTEMTGLVED